MSVRKLTNITVLSGKTTLFKLGRAKRIWYLSPMRAAKVQASLRIRAVSPEPSLLAHTSSESRGTFRQKARSLAPLNVWACAVKIGHDGMLEDTNSLDGAQYRIITAIISGIEFFCLNPQHTNTAAYKVCRGILYTLFVFLLVRLFILSYVLLSRS